MKQTKMKKVSRLPNHFDCQYFIEPRQYNSVHTHKFTELVFMYIYPNKITLFIMIIMNLILNQDMHLLIAEFIPNHLCLHCMTLSSDKGECCLTFRLLYQSQFDKRWTWSISKHVCCQVWMKAQRFESKGLSLTGR
jgi:hypothetical protein